MVSMYEVAKVIQHERLRHSEQRRIAAALPSCRTWAVGNYKVTVQRCPGARTLVAAGR